MLRYFVTDIHLLVENASAIFIFDVLTERTLVPYDTLGKAQNKQAQTLVCKLLLLLFLRSLSALLIEMVAS